MSDDHPINYSTFMRETSRERVRNDRKNKKLEDRLKAFQTICPHANTRFQEDPAGGNDSCYICILCDKSV